MTLEEIKKAPDVIVEQEYVKRDGRKHLGDTVYRSKRLKAEVRVKAPALGGQKQAQPEREASSPNLSTDREKRDPVAKK